MGRGTGRGPTIDVPATAMSNLSAYGPDTSYDSLSDGEVGQSSLDKRREAAKAEVARNMVKKGLDTTNVRLTPAVEKKMSRWIYRKKRTNADHLHEQKHTHLYRMLSGATCTFPAITLGGCGCRSLQAVVGARVPLFHGTAHRHQRLRLRCQYRESGHQIDDELLPHSVLFMSHAYGPHLSQHSLLLDEPTTQHCHRHYHLRCSILP